eukprot:m.124692 g.124692  ORF g.124692 m.124692 type:complete len:1264 (+) comp9677_c3_seq1:36-3827(+)
MGALGALLCSAWVLAGTAVLLAAPAAGDAALSTRRTDGDLQAMSSLGPALVPHLRERRASSCSSRCRCRDCAVELSASRTSPECPCKFEDGIGCSAEYTPDHIIVAPAGTVCDDANACTTDQCDAFGNCIGTNIPINCDFNERLIGTCTDLSTPVCVPCAVCTASQYVKVPCTNEVDTQCAFCTTSCPENHFLDNKCNGIVNSQCLECTPLCNPDTTYEIKGCSLLHNRECGVCHEECRKCIGPSASDCVECRRAVRNGVCVPECNFASEFEVLEGGVRACRPLRQCAEFEFQVAGPTSSTDRQCQTVKICPDSTFESRAPTSTSDRGCSPCKDCGDQQVRRACTAKFDTICLDPELRVHHTINFQILNATSVTKSDAQELLARVAIPPETLVEFAVTTKTPRIIKMVVEQPVSVDFSDEITQLKSILAPDLSASPAVVGTAAVNSSSVHFAESVGPPVTQPRTDSASASTSAAMIGGVVGGIVLVALIALIVVRRRMHASVHKAQRERRELEMQVSEIKAGMLEFRQSAMQIFLDEFSRAIAVLPTSAAELDDGFDSLEVQRERVRTQGNVLGRGAFGAVTQGILSCQGDRDVVVAIKSLFGGRDKDEQLSFLMEARVLHLVRHPNVVSLLGVVTVESPLWMLLEYMPNGSLKSFLVNCRPSAENRIRELNSSDLDGITMQVLEGLVHLERCTVVHRDLAARNVLVGDNLVVKISDFGLSRLTDNDYYIKQSSDKVPIKWMAPESIQSRRYSTKSDVWGFGVLCWEIYSLGAKPYEHTPPADLLALLKAGTRLSQPTFASARVYSLMKKCWEWKTNDRPDFSKLLEHFLDINPRFTNPAMAKGEVSIAPDAIAIEALRSRVSRSSFAEAEPGMISNPLAVASFGRAVQQEEDDAAYIMGVPPCSTDATIVASPDPDAEYVLATNQPKPIHEYDSDNVVAMAPPTAAAAATAATTSAATESPEYESDNVAAMAPPAIAPTDAPEYDSDNLAAMTPAAAICSICSLDFTAMSDQERQWHREACAPKKTLPTADPPAPAKSASGAAVHLPPTSKPALRAGAAAPFHGADPAVPGYDRMAPAAVQSLRLGPASSQFHGAFAYDHLAQGGSPQQQHQMYRQRPMQPQLGHHQQQSNTQQQRANLMQMQQHRAAAAARQREAQTQMRHAYGPSMAMMNANLYQMVPAGQRIMQRGPVPQHHMHGQQQHAPPYHPATAQYAGEQHRYLHSGPPRMPPGMLPASGNEYHNLPQVSDGFDLPGQVGGDTHC